MSVPTEQHPQDGIPQDQNPYEQNTYTGGASPMPPYGMPTMTDHTGIPPQPLGFSGLAISAICTFWLPLVGLVLSIVAVVKTGADKKRGRALAIVALVLSVLVSIGYGLVGAAIASKTSAIDPGCVNGKTAIIDGSKKLDGDQGSGSPEVVKTDLQSIIDKLDKAVADSHRSDVKSAMQAMSGDYTALLQGINDGNLDPNLQNKISADAGQVDHLCTIGSS